LGHGSGGRLGAIGLIFAATTAIGAVFHFVPAVCPFFAPGKRQTTNDTNFGRKVGFLALFGHGMFKRMGRAIQLAQASILTNFHPGFLAGSQRSLASKTPGIQAP
jgi:hypothetical protein